MRSHFKANGEIAFLKMHGAGNDFIVIDNRTQCHTEDFSGQDYRCMADRRYGIGCDQIVLLEHSKSADVFMRLYNADGGEVSACGNATRCVAWLVMEETGKKQVTVKTRAGMLRCERAGDFSVKVDMGPPRFGWREIPLARDVDIQHLPIGENGLQNAVAVSMGNPHAVFFVEDISSVSLEILGPKLEHDALFPQRANIEAAQVVNRRQIRVRVWERGAGETLACGTGACATMVAARLRGFVEEKAIISLPGGDLQIEWNGKEITDIFPVFMTGPVALVYSGIWKL